MYVYSVANSTSAPAEEQTHTGESSAGDRRAECCDVYLCTRISGSTEEDERLKKLKKKKKTVFISILYRTHLIMCIRV